MSFFCKYKNGVILAVSFLLLVNNSASGKEFVITARVIETPPYSYIENGKWQGLNIDLYRALVETAGFNLEYIQQPWSRSFRNLKTGKLHLTAFLTPSPERAKYTHFIGPHAVDEIRVYLHKNYKHEKLESVDDMITLSLKAGLKFGLQQDYVVSEEFDKRFQNDESLRASMSIHVGLGDGLRMVNLGRLIGIIETKTNGDYNIKMNSVRYRDVIDSGFTLASTDVYFGVSKTLPGAVVRALSQANAQLINAGIYKKIMSDWVGSSESVNKAVGD